ncbi:MAG: tetratricopeptide repeat protein [Cyanobacteria bacterium J06626_18]
MGRQHELQVLHQKLQASDQVAIAALAGMGGIGKTALAQQYVRAAKDAYPGGRWYFKVREQGLVAQLVNAATIFGWQLPDDLTDDQARVNWCYDQWRSHYPGSRLLLLDDVQQYRDVKPFLPVDDPSLRVLMTSRQRFGKPVDRLDLGVLPLQEAVALLTRLIDDANRVREQPTAAALCEWVGRLPLGVELIARYLALHEHMTFATLQKRLETKRLEARAFRNLPEEMAYEYSIQAAFDLSWQDLPPEAKTVMGLLAIFAPAPIPQALIEGALPEWDEEDLEDSLDAVLVQRNLLQSDTDGSYQLHQLLREFTVTKLETDLSTEKLFLQRSVALAMTRFASRIEPIVRVNARQSVSLAIPHLALVAQTLISVLADDEDPGWMFTGLARFYESQSLWPEAEHWYRERLKMSEQRFGPDHPDTATSLNNLAGLYRSMGRYSEAAPFFARSLEIREAQLGVNHPATAASLNNLAGLYESMGRYSEAEPLLARSLEIREAQLGAAHPDTATGLNNLAELYRSMGRYSEAEPLLARSLEIREAQLGVNHPATATSLNNLALLYKSMGRYSEAESLLARSLEICKAQLGAAHPATASSLNNLALLYKSMGRYSEAEPLLTRSLEICKAQLGTAHPTTAMSLNNLAELYSSMSRYGEAESLLARSLEIYKVQLGAAHPTTATSLNNSAALYKSMGRYSEAESLYVRAIKIFEKSLPPDHPYIFTGKENFRCLLQAVINANQTNQLSDHPLTQALLRDLQSS